MSAPGARGYLQAADDIPGRFNPQDRQLFLQLDALPRGAGVTGGVAAFDDHLSALYPGTAAAVWSAVATALPPGPPAWVAGLEP